MPELGQAFGQTCKSALSGALAPLKEHPDVELSELTLDALYHHALQVTTEQGGSIGIAVGPAQVSLNASQNRIESSDSNLVIRAVYRSRMQPTLTPLPEPPGA